MAGKANVKVDRLKTSVADMRRMDQLQADNAKLQADLEYVAMMADVDMDEEGEA